GRGTATGRVRGVLNADGHGNRQVTSPCDVTWRVAECQQHSAVTEGVRFHCGQVQDFVDAGVAGMPHLFVDLRADRGSGDLLETVLREEVFLEGQDEDTGQAELRGKVDQSLHECVPDPVPAGGSVDHDGAQFRDVVPEYVERTRADDVCVEFGDPELLDVFVERDQFLFQQHPPGVGIDELFDHRDVRDAGPADVDLGMIG